jgi:heptosyltransferase-2
MPGSRWQGKRWAPEKFLAVIRACGGMAVVLGGPGDKESFALVEMLLAEGVPHVSGVGRWDLPAVAQVLAHSTGYLGCDTGLAHLAEAVGVPALVVFGPTSPEMGFGPWRPESRSAGMDLWCRPCGKDGRRCYRPVNKYLCMTGLETSSVANQFRITQRAQQSESKPDP